MFFLAVKIAAPIIASLFLVDLSLALISKSAPQMHVLVLGFPIKLAVGFLFLTLLFQILSMVITDYVQGLDAVFMNMLQAMRPPSP
jgi:Flagellar biosynthesis pathway, component FliR